MFKKRYGNSYFVSRDILEQKPVGPKDDLFSIYYILISLIILHDKLPWKIDQGHEHISKNRNNALKKTFKIEENINSEFKELIELFLELQKN